MRIKLQDESISRELQVDERMRDLFPLPLAPFELLMLLDDRPELPMTSWAEMVFRGRLDRHALQVAVDDSVARHPLLRARVEWKQRIPTWVLPEDHSTQVTWLSESNRMEADQIRPLDLRRESGLRVFAADGDTQSSVWLHVHHACCDGLGARRFFLDLLTGYARARAPHQAMPAWDALDFESLRRRHQFDVVTATGVQAQTSTWQKLRDAFHFHVLTPQPLSPVQKLVGPPRVTPALKHVFNSQETTQLRQLTRELNTSMNDVAMALLFVSLSDWNRRFGAAPDSQRLRVLMPTDLRSARDDVMPAANRMSFAFIARTIRQCQTWDALLAGIRSETRHIKQIRIGLDFLGGITLALQVPGLVPRLLRLPRCMATAVLTNLGDPTKRFRRRFPTHEGSMRIGNVDLDHIFTTPPIRSHVHAGFGLVVCSRQLCISMVGNSQVLGDQAGELMQSYVNQWRKWGALK